MLKDCVQTTVNNSRRQSISEFALGISFFDSRGITCCEDLWRIGALDRVTGSGPESALHASKIKQF